MLSSTLKKLGVNRLSSGPLCAYDRKMRTRRDAVEQGQEIASQERNRLGLGVAPVGDPASFARCPGDFNPRDAIAARAFGFHFSPARLLSA